MHCDVVRGNEKGTPGSSPVLPRGEDPGEYVKNIAQMGGISRIG
jgi:hypothetical protein